MTKGWKYQSARHSMAARGIKSSYYAKQGFINRSETRLGRLETMQIEQQEPPKDRTLKEYWKSRWGELMDTESAWIRDENGALVEKRAVLEKLFGEKPGYFAKKQYKRGKK